MNEVDKKLVAYSADAFIPKSGKAKDGTRVSDGFDGKKVNAFTLVESRQKEHSPVIERKVKGMIRTTEQVTKELNETVEKFGLVLDRLTDKEKEVTEKTKVVGSKVKDSTNKLGEGLTKLEKTCNFQKMERYAETLSNLADSLERISDLEKTGKLDKLIQAMKG